MKVSRPVLAFSAAVLAAGGLAVATTAHAAAAGCSVNYQITSQWSGGFGADVTVAWAAEGHALTDGDLETARSWLAIQMPAPH
jgi:O-glycosyl hydrolase